MRKDTAVVKYEEVEAIFRINNPQDHIQKHLKSTNSFYELDMLEDVKRRVGRKNPVIIDAGAYIGNHSIFFAKCCDAKVIAFEPYIESYNNLKKNIEINNLQNIVTAHNYALGSSRKTGGMVVANKSNTGMTKVEPNAPGDIEIRTLDEVVLNNVKRIDVLKIDVEGMEVELLKGAVQAISRYKPLIYVEAFENERLREIIKLLAPMGYRVADVFNSTPTYLFITHKKRNKIKSFIKNKSIVSS